MSGLYESRYLQELQSRLRPLPSWGSTRLASALKMLTDHAMLPQCPSKVVTLDLPLQILARILSLLGSPSRFNLLCPATDLLLHLSLASKSCAVEIAQHAEIVKTLIGLLDDDSMKSLSFRANSMGNSCQTVLEILEILIQLGKKKAEQILQTGKP